MLLHVDTVLDADVDWLDRADGESVALPEPLTLASGEKEGETDALADPVDQDVDDSVVLPHDVLLTDAVVETDGDWLELSEPHADAVAEGLGARVGDSERVPLPHAVTVDEIDAEPLSESVGESVKLAVLLRQSDGLGESEADSDGLSETLGDVETLAVVDEDKHKVGDGEWDVVLLVVDVGSLAVE